MAERVSTTGSSGNASPERLIKLATWLSPAFPIGAFSYSHGLECAMEDGSVRTQDDLRAWLLDVLQVGGGWTDAVLFAEAWRAAHAADWVAVTLPQSEDRYFYDRSKLVINGPEITYWKKIQFKQPQKVKERLAVSGLMREQIHCTQHTLRLLSFLYHDAAGGDPQHRELGVDGAGDKWALIGHKSPVLG